MVVFYQVNCQVFSHQEMSPETWDKLIQDKIKRDKSKYEINMEASTDQFKCFKCKKKTNVTYYELQNSFC